MLVHHHHHPRSLPPPPPPKPRDVAQAGAGRRRGGAGGGAAVPEEEVPADGPRHDVAGEEEGESGRCRSDGADGSAGATRYTQIAYVYHGACCAACLGGKGDSRYTGHPREIFGAAAFFSEIFYGIHRRKDSIGYPDRDAGATSSFAS